MNSSVEAAIFDFLWYTMIITSTIAWIVHLFVVAPFLRRHAGKRWAGFIPVTYLRELGEYRSLIVEQNLSVRWYKIEKNFTVSFFVAALTNMFLIVIFGLLNA